MGLKPQDNLMAWIGCQILHVLYWLCANTFATRCWAFHTSYNPMTKTSTKNNSGCQIHIKSHRNKPKSKSYNCRNILCPLLLTISINQPNARSSLKCYKATTMSRMNNKKLGQSNCIRVSESQSNKRFQHSLNQTWV